MSFYQKLKAAEADDHAGEQQLAEQYDGEDALHIVHVTHDGEMLPHAVPQPPDHQRDVRRVHRRTSRPFPVPRALDAPLGDDLHLVRHDLQLRGRVDVERDHEIVEAEGADARVYRRERLRTVRWTLSENIECVDANFPSFEIQFL